MYDMKTNNQLMPLDLSMERTLEFGNLSVVTDIGEIILDSTLNDGILKEIPILGTIVGASKCIRNVSDVLFTEKLITFLCGLCEMDSNERRDAINSWKSDSHYQVRVGETLLGMIHRCDDSQKAKWLSQLFYVLVLKNGTPGLFMRAEKVLSALSVVDVYSFLSLPSYEKLSLKDCEPFANSGLYIVDAPKGQVAVEVFVLKDTMMSITEVGKCIYTVLNNNQEL